MMDDHDKILCERLATTVDHGICKCVERHLIAALEAELADRTQERDEARMHFAMVAMHFPEGDLTIGAVKQLAVEWLREHDAAERERREAAEAALRQASL